MNSLDGASKQQETFLENGNKNNTSTQNQENTAKIPWSHHERRGLKKNRHWVYRGCKKQGKAVNHLPDEFVLMRGEGLQWGLAKRKT